MAMMMGTHISEMLTADTIAHTKVVNQQGEKLGDIKDLVIGLESGCVNYAILDEGGFLGMGGKHFAIPWQAFMVDQKNDQIILNVSKDKLDKAPEIDRNTDYADPSWMKMTNEYYGYGTGTSSMSGSSMSSGGMGGGSMGGGSTGGGGMGGGGSMGG